MNFGEKLRAIRESRGMTSAELGKALKLPEKTIRSYEEGTRLPVSSTVYEYLADALKCKVEDLTGDEAALSDLPFGTRLRNLRTDKRLTLSQAAEAVGISVGQYKAHEYQNARPRNAALYDKFAEILGCEVSSLTAGDERFENGVLKGAPVPAVPMSEPFGKRLSSLRKAKNLTLAQIAKKAGVTLDVYKNLEYKNGRPRDAKVYNKLAKVLGCDASYLKEGDKRFEKKEPVEKKPEKKVIIIPPKKKAEAPKQESAPARAKTAPKPQPDFSRIEDNIPEEPVKAPLKNEKESSAGSEVIKLVSRLSVLLAGDEISKNEKDAVMVALNGAYWKLL